MMIKRVTADMQDGEIESLKKALSILKRYFYQYLNGDREEG